MKSKKKNDKYRPYSLNCGDGIVVEVSKGCFIGADFSPEGNGGFVLVDDICDAYIGVEGEFDDELEQWKDKSDGKNYPKQYRVKKTLKVIGEKKIEME